MQPLYSSECISQVQALFLQYKLLFWNLQLLVFTELIHFSLLQPTKIGEMAQYPVKKKLYISIPSETKWWYIFLFSLSSYIMVTVFSDTCIRLDCILLDFVGGGKQKRRSCQTFLIHYRIGSFSLLYCLANPSPWCFQKIELNAYICPMLVALLRFPVVLYFPFIAAWDFRHLELGVVEVTYFDINIDMHIHISMIADIYFKAMKWETAFCTCWFFFVGVDLLPSEDQLN